MTKQVYTFTGPKGTGKSTALATFSRPDDLGRVLVLDTEDSQGQLIEQISKLGFRFGEYIRAYDRYQADEDMLVRMAKGDHPWVSREEQNSLVSYYKWLIKTLAAKCQPGKFDTVLIDTIEPIEAAMTAVVEAKGKDFGWSGQRAYGRMETEGVRPLYEALLEGLHRTGVQNILIASHIKPVWIDKKPVPGKVKPGGRLAVLARLSTAMFWLVHESSNPDGAPAALVLKARMGRMAIDKETGRLSPSRALPERMPHFSWIDVDRYIEKPANFEDPAPGEIMTDGEREMISQMLNDAQLKYMVMGAQRERDNVIDGALRATNKTVTLDVGPEARVKALADQGKSATEISREMGMPLPVVSALMGKADG